MTRRTKAMALLVGVLACLVPIAYSLYITDRSDPDWLKSSYWQATVGGFLATVAGIVLGLPIAAWVNDIGERRKQDADAAAQVQHERQQVTRLCDLLQTELTESYNLLGPIAEGEINRFRFSTARWDAVMSSGDIRWLGDLEVVSTLAEAYEALEVANTLGGEWLRSMSSPPGQSAWPGTSTAPHEVLQRLLSDAAADARDKAGPAISELTKIRTRATRME